MTTARKSPGKPAAKKVATKKTAAKKAVTKPPVTRTLKPRVETMYTMPREVAEWIERANSTIQHLKGQVERLKTEVTELKAYKKWAEHRILRSDYE